MSRIILKAKNPEHTVVIGLDHAMGWFCQLFNGKNEDGEDILEIDRDSLFGGLNKGQLLNFIEKYAEDNEQAKNCSMKIALDLDPAHPSS